VFSREGNIQKGVTVCHLSPVMFEHAHHETTRSVDSISDGSRVTNETCATRGSGTSIDAAGSVTIAAGTATRDLKRISNNVWNNDGDTAYLYDGSGWLVDQKRDDHERDRRQI